MGNDTDKKYLVALDAGGTMTDTFLVDQEGDFVLGKSLTDHTNEANSYITSVDDAASFWDVKSKDVHAEAQSSTYTGTTMLNVLITQTGMNVGLLITSGFEHMPLTERGHTWLGQSYEDILHQQLHEHTPWLVKPHNVKPIKERIHGGSYFMAKQIQPGTVIIPLDEEDVRKGVNELLDSGVEVIGIITICSHINDVHEKKAAEIAREIVKERDAGIEVFASSEMCPVGNENERMKSLLFQCYFSEIGREQLFNVENVAKEDGYDKNLLTLLSYGAACDIRYPRLYEAVISGPIGGLLACKVISEEIDLKNIICADLGGTTFDVGIIANGTLSTTKNPVFASHKLRLPMVVSNSIGAGSGSVIRVDEVTKRITLGPESAGSDVGTCYVYPEITIGDIDLILGYLSEDNFLGGKIKLNKEEALKRLQQDLADPLGMDLYEVSSKVLDMLHADMCDEVNAMLQSRGLSPAEFTLLVYGGSGPLHGWGIQRGGIHVADMVTMPWAAAMSAFGCAAAEYFHRYDKAVTFLYTPIMPEPAKLMQAQKLTTAWKELEEKALKELSDEGIPEDKVYFRYGVSARYIGQIFTWDAPVVKGNIETIEDVHEVLECFENLYTSIYPVAARYPDIGYQITEVYLEAGADKIKPKISVYKLGDKKPPKQASKGMRDCYMDGKWQPFSIWDMDSLEAGNRIDGPAIIEHPMSTWVIPPEQYVAYDERRFIWHRMK